MDEFFDTLTEKTVKSKIFYDSEKEFFEDLLRITDTKHYTHLRFLSSKHLHSIMKLRFIIKPFSFIFLVEGKSHYTIVWETLNTEEATYIWFVNKSRDELKIALGKIDKIISSIRIQGKIQYINTTGDNFKRVYHDYSDLSGGFLKWKYEFEKALL